jgi:Flp pilus assembly protein TadG
MKIFKSTDCKGQVLVVTAIVLVVLVVLVGLAIDSGRSYSVKAKLNAALDAAGIAAARQIANGTQPAIDAATTFFNSNYPAGYMQSTPSFCPDSGGVPIITTDPSSGDIAITVSATATMPTLFMKVIGQDIANVASTTTATRRAADLAFVVDNTGSIGSDGPDVKARSIDFVHAFQENFDRLALVKYAYGAQVPVPIRTDARGFPLSTVETEIGNFVFNGYTNCAEGFWQGINQLEAVDTPSSIRVIVFFTDGAPNTISSYFHMDDNKYPRGSIRSGDIDPDSGAWSSRDVAGLYRHDLLSQVISAYNYTGGWWSSPTIAQHLLGLPDFYNAHTTDLDTGDPYHYNPDPDDPDYQKFRIITGDGSGLFDDMIPGTRLVEQCPGPNFQGNYICNTTQLHDRINNASRNILEAMAKEARQQGIFVYTLGLGDFLDDEIGPNREKGEVILLRMANDINADIRFADEPEGFYCHAVDTDHLGPCFDQIVAAIIRLTI